METKIFKISSNEIENDKIIKETAEIIKQNGLVVFPTETVYGLGADATSKIAAKKIFEAKGRPSDNPLIIHIANPLDAERYTYTNELYYKLADAFMPGPLTVVLPSKETIPKETRGGLETVAVRCPENETARRLISMSGVPIAAPSANLSGTPSPTSAKHVIDDMMGRVDAIIDGGDASFGLESTIVKIEADNSVTLLRPGKITYEMLSSVVGKVEIASAVTNLMKAGEVALSPGMKYKHYAPRTELLLLDADIEKTREFIVSENLSGVAIIAYDEDIDYLKEKIPDAFYYSFGKKNDEEKQAHELFSILRDTDNHNFKKIYAPLPRISGIGLALYNRMIRAAAHKIKKL
jgi:L-threonylcarbamoyladenylate synthase